MSKKTEKLLKRVYRVVREGFNEFGEKIANPKPVAIPARFERPESLEQQMARMVRTTLAAQQAAQGMDSFDEYDDFEEDDSNWDSQFVVTELEATVPQPTVATPKAPQDEAPTGAPDPDDQKA